MTKQMPVWELRRRRLWRKEMMEWKE